MIFKFFSLFWLFPHQRSRIRVSHGAAAVELESPLSPRPASRAGLCQRLNKRLRPLDARPVTSPIHKTGTGCQAGAARAVAMETTNPALSASLSPPVTCGPPAGGLGMCSLPARVSGQRSPYCPAPHLDCPYQVHSLGRLGNFFTIASPSPALLRAWGKGPEFCCWVNLVESRAL